MVKLLMFEIRTEELTEIPQKHTKPLQYTGCLLSKAQRRRNKAENDLPRYGKQKEGLESKENSLVIQRPTNEAIKTRRDLPRF